MSAADWKPYDVPGMAGLLAEQPTDSGTHAMAWEQAYETLTDQRQRLESARTALLAAWPATPGSAAGSFFDQVDALTQAMSASAEIAVSAHGALTGIVTAVDGATAKVDTLHQSWRQKQATIGDFLPADEWTRPLNNQAHVIMGQADAAIAEHATQLAPPVPYTPAPPIQTYRPIQTPSGSTRASNTPAARRSESTEPANLASRQSVATENSTPAVSTNRTPTISPVPVLTNGQSTARGTPEGLATADPALSRAGGNSFDHIGSEGLMLGSTVLVDPMGVIATPIRGSAPNNSDPTMRDSHASPSSVAKPNIPGSSGSSGSSGRLSPAAPSSSIRVENGTFGGRDANNAVRYDTADLADPRATSATSTAGHAETAPFAGMLQGAPMTGSGAAQGRGRRDNGQLSSWPTPSGVRPIIVALPEAQVDHDPGPGVIGIDR